MAKPVVAVLGRGVVPADTPLLRADDLGVLRGDGVFETMHVRRGVPWLLEEHMARMVRSAARMHLALPDLAQLIELAEQACAAWPADTEGAVRLVCTRGSESTAATGGPPTCFATVNPVSLSAIAARDNGVRLATMSLGLAAGGRTDAPWLLGGVKSLSYAINMASLRHAAMRGVEDVLWVSTDGFALEAPTASLVWRDGDVLATVDVEATGVLAGITTRYALHHADELGLKAEQRMITAAALHDVGGAWLLSSVRGLTEITEIDGVARDRSPDTARLRRLLGF